MERRPQTLYPIASDKSVFITAVHPGVAEDDVTAATMPISWDTPGRTRRQRGQPQEEQLETITVRGSVGTARAFVMKCLRQITDFRLPVEERNGEVKIRKHDPRNNGDNRGNLEVYEHILTSVEPLDILAERTFWDVVEGFLDSVAGRGGDVAEDFEDLKKELPQLVSDT